MWTLTPLRLYFTSQCEMFDLTVAGIKGIVFHDKNHDGIKQDDEEGVAGVMVSDSLHVVNTDAMGQYLLPYPTEEYESSGFAVMITEPDGYDVPMSKDNVPQFFYIHKPHGSPTSVHNTNFRFGGLKPTGDLPEYIHFPLHATDPLVNKKFKVATSGDPQVYSNDELGYLRESLVTEILDIEDLEAVVIEGDVMGDDLDMFKRFREIVGVAGVPQYYVAGNHDLDFDAESDLDSFDTFRHEFGPEYYSFDLGMVHFIVLDNVKYPCDAEDNRDGLHGFCESGTTYNGMVTNRQLDWLKNNLAHVSEDKLLFIQHHIPTYSFIDQNLVKHSISNVISFYETLGCKRSSDGWFYPEDCKYKIVSLSAHTHTNENILPGEDCEGWRTALGEGGAGPPPYHQVIVGAASGSWWSGDFGMDKLPESIRRLGSPRGYYVWEFDGADYVESFKVAGMDADKQMSVDVSTPEFREWFHTLKDWGNSGPADDEKPPVNINTLADTKIILKKDLEDSHLSVNVWNGSRQSQVHAMFDGSDEVHVLTRTNPGEGENILETLDPFALKRQMQVARYAYTTTNEEVRANGWELFRGSNRCGTPGHSCTPRPQAAWTWTDQSSHVWQMPMPADLEIGVHTIHIKTVDRHGREYSDKMVIEVAEERPYKFFNMDVFSVLP